uniref:Serine/threonine-protein phosphatase n=1 Tax=Hyaloperonospora arabidopsidis (strain Emoy2) TaxID=559515 RepID=M4BB21_HYAAE
MASKLNAFLAAVPANASVSKSSPPALSVPQSEPQATPEPIESSLKIPQTHHCFSSLQRLQQDLSLSNSSDKAQDQPEDDRVIARPSLLKSFMATQAAAAKLKAYKDEMAPNLMHSSSCTELDAKSEAGPMRLTTVQGPHYRRVSTDTTLFNRYLRQQADRDIGQETVQHFTNVPIVTATAVREDNVESETSEDCSDDTEHVEQVLDPQEILARFRVGETIPVSSALEIIRRATSLMSLEQNVISIRAPYTLVGDLHGQFQDMLELFRVHGFPAVDNPFLFLGDYVDRGVSSCEIILLLLAFKVDVPESVHLLRGNHECRSLSTFYGFRAECLQKYGPAVYNRMIKCFESMPLAARLETVHGTFLAVHGGLSPDITFVEDINAQVNRFMEPEPKGVLCDLLWSDPARGEAQEYEWAPNSIRGCSFTFNEHACHEFLKRNNLLAIIRAHELEEDGYKEHFRHEADHPEDDTGGELVLPAVVTVFSAPEYCNTNHNVGATLKIPWEKQNDRLLQYQQHKRSRYSEFNYARPSEDKAVKALLKEHLPFLPIDFYDLVNVCRQLRFTLDRAANMSSSSRSSAIKPLRKKMSFVSSLCAPSTALETTIREDVELPISPPYFAPVSDLEIEHNAAGTSGDLLQDWEIVGESKSVETAGTINLTKYLKNEKTDNKLKTKLEKKHKQQKDKKSWDTNRIVSGWKFSPAFVRFYDRYFARDSVKKCDPDVSSAPSHPGKRVPGIYRSPSSRSTSTGEVALGLEANDTVVETTGPSRRKSMTDWMPMPSFEQVARLTNTLQGHITIEGSGVNVFTKSQWQALKLWFSILDLDGKGVLVEESFVVLLAEQDTDAYATEDELSLLMEVMDCNADSRVTEQDFLLFAYRALLQWKKSMHGSGK